MKKITSLLNEQPVENRATFYEYLKMAKAVVAHSAANLMNSTAMAIVLSPSFSPYTVQDLNLIPETEKNAIIMKQAEEKKSDVLVECFEYLISNVGTKLKFGNSDKLEFA